MTKKLIYLLILLFCFATAGCSLKEENGTLNTSENAKGSAEWVASDSKPAKKIDRYLSAMESLGFSGAIIVSEGDEVVLRKGYGYANRETRQPYTPETIQTSGSITKQFTGAAILLLESRGELSVNDPISNYLDPLSDEMQDITIHQLLTHSSGMPGGIGSDDQPIGDEAYLDRLMDESLQFDPGSRYAYSNTGYSLMGMIVEEVSGQSYEEFLREEVLLPAGMKHTGYILPDWDRNRMAIGYRNGKRWGEVYQRGWIDDGPNWHLRGNGGIHTTVGDMSTWLKTVQGRGILEEDAARRWTTGYEIENGEFSEYGYGWRVYKHNNWGQLITHGGSNLIFEADFVWLPERDFFFYIQGNTSMVPARSQSGNILNAAFDSTFVMPTMVEENEDADPALARQRAGIYILGEGKLELTADDTRLVTKLTGQSVFDLMYNHSDEQKTRFAELNERTRIAMDKIQAGQEDALSGLIHEETDAIEATAPFLRRINQIGNLDSLHMAGTFANAPGSWFHKSGSWTTFVYAEFENWNQYWNLIWDEDETFVENLSGPWPSFTLIPAGEDKYIGVNSKMPYNTVNLSFSGNCIVIKGTPVCPDL